MVAPVAAAAAPSIFNPLFSGLGTAASGLLTGAGQAGPALSGGNPLFSDRNYINVAPVGVNLGEILRNWEGPTENGGFGLEKKTRLGQDVSFKASLLGSEVGFSTGILPVLLLVGGSVFLFWALK